MKKIILFFLFIVTITACDEDNPLDELKREGYAMVIDLRSGKEEVVAIVKDDLLREGDFKQGLTRARITGNKIYHTVGNLDVLANVVGDRILQGDTPYGEVIARINGKNIIEGSSQDGPVIARIDGNSNGAAELGAVYLLLVKNESWKDTVPNKIFEGNSTLTVIATAYGNELIEGNSAKGNAFLYFIDENICEYGHIFETVIANLDGDKVKRGKSKDGAVIALINGKKVIKGDSPSGEVIATIEREEKRVAALAAAYLLLYTEEELTLTKVIKGTSLDDKVVGVVKYNKFIRGDSRTGTVYLKADKGKIAYELRKGEIIANKDGNKVIKGDSPAGEVIALLDGDKIIKGESPEGPIIGRVEGDEPMAGAFGAAYLLLIDTNSGPWDGKTSTKIIKGGSTYGTTVAVVYDNKLMKGNSTYGTTIAVADGNSIVKGSSKYGTTIAVLDGDKVVKGTSKYGEVIAVIDGNKIIKGGSRYGTIIGVIDGNGEKMAGALGAAFFLLLDSSSEGGTPTNSTSQIVKGTSKYGTTVAVVNNNELIKGTSKYGTTVAVANGNNIIKGSSKYGSTIAVLDGNKVVKGTSKYGEVIAVIDGKNIVKGTSKYGTVIGVVDGNGGNMAGALGAVFLLLL